MNEFWVARQPIFDRALKVVGYELLFRGGQTAEALVGDPERATANVVLGSFTEIGLDQLVGTHLAWINVTRDFVLGGFVESLPPDLVLLELLENQTIDDRLIDAVAELHKRGYRFALDDFQYDPGAEPLLRFVDVVKLDVLALGRPAFSREAARLERAGVTLLAEKVETYDEFRHCHDAGCHLFQGFFFRRPELMRGTRVDANRVALIELLAALQDPGVDLSELERMIARDLALSYRLLRYINSAFFGLRQQVRSIGQAVALLGIETLKHWAALSIFASIDDKPRELTTTALIRARFCELAGAQRHDPARPSELFTLGLFSVIDALMDTPIEDILAKIPFPDDIRSALATHDGRAGELLDCVSAVETGDFDRAASIIPNAGELHVAALMWANSAADPLYAEDNAAA